MSQMSHTDITKIAYCIRDRILQGVYAPGDKLSESRLSVEFDCSRTPVREALKRLEADRFVEILPNSGTYVRKPTIEETIQITEIRSYMEALAFRLACEANASADTLELLVEQMEDILSAENVDFYLFGKTHFRFHYQIVYLSGNDVLAENYARLNIGFSSIFYSSLDEEMKKLTLDEHRTILRLFKERKAEEGSAFMQKHLWGKRDRLIKCLQEGKGEFV